MTEYARLDTESAKDQFYRLLVEQSADVIWSVDNTGKLTYISPAIQQLTGYSPKEVLSRSWAETFTPETNAVVTADIERIIELAAKGERVPPRVIEMELNRKDGSTVWAETIRLCAYDDSGRFVGIHGSTRDTTEQRRVIEKLRESEHFLQTLMDAIPNPIFYKDAEAVYQGCNKAFEVFLGKSKDQIVGSSVFDVAPIELADIYHEMDMKLLSQGGTQVYESQVKYADGTVHDVIFNKARFSDSKGDIGGLVGIILDITDRKRAEGQLLKEKSQLQMLLDYYQRAYSRVEDLMAFVVEECQKISESGMGFFGFINEEETEMRTHVWSEQTLTHCAIDNKPVIFPLSKAGMWAEAIRTHEPLIINDYHQEDPRKKGCPAGHVPIDRLMCLPVIEDNKAVAVLAVANKAEAYSDSDLMHLRLFIESMWGILKRREAEDKLRQLNEELEQLVHERTLQLVNMQEELMRKEKLAVLGQLSGGISHELRNPLAVMSSAVFLLKSTRPDADENYREYIEIIEREIEKSQQIISDLLDFARTKPAKKVPVPVSDLIDEVLSLCSVPKNVTVIRQIDEGLPTLWVDRQQMDQVIQNLITNGIQALSKGGTLTIQAAVQDSDRLRISIIDDGPGISPENLKKLFQPLFTTKPQGIGLGLVVCKNLVENNDGTIGVTSEPGRGTTFVLSLPRVAES